MEKEKEKIKLADGREIEGVRVDYYGFYVGMGKFGVDVLFPPAWNGRTYQFTKILEVTFRYLHPGDICLPKVEVLESKLWTKDLVRCVIATIRQSDGVKRRAGDKLFSSEKIQQAIEYIITKLRSFFGEKKELILEGGRRLVGDLEFDLHSSKESGGCDDLDILGDVKDIETGEIKKERLLTIKNLGPNPWFGTGRTPSHVINKEFWCKMTEYLIIGYLNFLASFAEGNLSKQICEIANDLSGRSEWATKCQTILQKLLILDPDSRED